MTRPHEPEAGDTWAHVWPDEEMPVSLHVNSIGVRDAQERPALALAVEGSPDLISTGTMERIRARLLLVAREEIERGQNPQPRERP